MVCQGLVWAILLIHLKSLSLSVSPSLPPSLSPSIDTLALLLTDVLVFLQEKDQRFVFAAVVRSFDMSCQTVHTHAFQTNFQLINGFVYRM